MGVSACLLDNDTPAFQRLIKQLRGEGKSWKEISQVAKERGLISEVSGQVARVKKLNPLGLKTPAGPRYGSTQVAKARARAVQKGKLAEEFKLSPAEIAVRQQARRVQGRAGGEFRGSSKDRRASRERLATEFGDGTYAPCVHCGVKLYVDDVTRDKIIPGEEGGTYRHENLIPACASCNKSRQDKPLRTFWRRIRELAA